MKESVALAKDADAKKDFSSTRSGNSIHRVRNESERQLGSLRSVIGNIRHDGGTPSVDSIATELSSMHTAQRASVLLALQRTHGNRYVQRVVTGIQAKLKVGQPGDVYEQEADRVAEQVMRMPEPRLQRRAEEEEEEEEEEIQTKSLSHQITPLVQRQVEPEEEEEEIQTKPISEQKTPLVQRQENEVEEEEEPIQTKLIYPEHPILQRQKEEPEEEGTFQTKEIPSRTPEVAPNLEVRINAMRGGGQPMPESVRAFFEPRFGYDFSDAQIHTNAQATELAWAVNARAYTVGQDIFFGSGQYAPGTTEGKRLLAHELVHTIQQKGISSHLHHKSVLNAESENYESENRTVANRVAAGQVSVVQQRAPNSQIMRNPGPYEDKFQEFQQYIHQRNEQIASMPLGTERSTHEAILRQLNQWVQDHHQQQEFLDSEPSVVYEQISHGVITYEVFSQIERERRAPQDEASRQRKINEYWDLAHQLWGYRSRTIRSIEIPSEHRAVIIQASSAFQEVLNDLAGQLIDWGYGNYFMAGFTVSDPIEVLAEIADRPRNRLALALAQTQPVETESVPIPEERREWWQTGLELLIGFIPIIGDISDIAQAFSGVDIWGGRLGTGGRTLMMLGALIPLVPGRALRGPRDATELAMDLAQQTGRHAGEIMPIIRAAESFRRQDVELIENAVQAIRQGQQLDAAHVRQIEEVLERVGHDLRRSLPGAVRRGATRVFVEFTEESIEHVGVRHVPEMFDPRRALRLLNDQSITDPTHVTHLFPPGMASSDRRLTTLMRQAVESREAATSTGRVFEVNLRRLNVRVVTGAGPGGQGVRIVSMYPTRGVGVTREQIEQWAQAVEQGRMSVLDVRRAIEGMFRGG